MCFKQRTKSAGRTITSRNNRAPKKFFAKEMLPSAPVAHRPNPKSSVHKPNKRHRRPVKKKQKSSHKKVKAKDIRSMIGQTNKGMADTLQEFADGELKKKLQKIQSHL